MPKFPIYGPILFDKGEICPHNKIAKTVKRVYHREPPIRLNDVCQMRKLGDHKFQPEYERNNSNYLWHVTLNTGNNPYVGATPKIESNVSRVGTAWNLHNMVFEKMRNGLRRYCAQTPTQKPCDTTAVEWIMKPRELADDSSQEGYIGTRHTRKKRIRSAQSTPPVTSNCKKRSLFLESKARRNKYSLSAHFAEALAKNKKNLENEKRRIDTERVEGGQEQHNTQALRKSVIVKKKLADTLKKGVNAQKSVLDMKAALKKKKHILKVVKYIAHAPKTGRTPQQQTHKPLTMPPVSPSPHKATKLELSTATSKTGRLRKINFQNFTERLSDISIWCPRKSSFQCFESMKKSTEASKGPSVEKEDTSIAILRRLTQVFKNPPKEPPAIKVEESPTMPSAPKAPLGAPNMSEELVNKVERGGVVKKKYFRRYRTFRRRVKHSRQVKDKPVIEEQHEDKAVQCIDTKSSSSTLSLSSGSSVLLSDSNKEIGAWLGGHEEELRLAHESRLSRKSATTTSKETEKSEGNNPCNEFTISFHTPITLRQLIQRNTRVKRTKDAQKSKRTEPNVPRLSDPKTFVFGSMGTPQSNKLE